MELSASYSVSVVIPCFNSETFIERAINSALAQALQPLEVLVYDDASTDGTRAVIEAIAAKNSKVRFFGGEINRGAGVARNFLLKQCKGNLIAFLDSDDYWHPFKLSKQVPLFADEHVGIVTGYQRIVDDERGDLGIRTIALPIGFATMHLTNWLPTSMTVVRSDLMQVRTMPSTRMRQDYAYWLRLLRANPGMQCSVVKEEVGIVYRRRGSVSGSPMRNVKANLGVFRSDLGYNTPVSLTLVLIQAVIRLFRK